MASHRKDSVSGSIGLAPRAKVVAAANLSAEYIEALKLLNEETMSKACDLLLSDRDYRDGVESEEIMSTEKSDLQQLKDLFHQCDKACTIISQEAVNLPSMPVLHGHQPVQRPGMVPSARVPAASKPPAPKSIMSNRRMAMARVPPVKNKSGLVGMGAGTVKRAERHKSMPDMSQQVAEFANKRQRTGSIVLQQPASKVADESNGSKNPPPAAMQFLAKLNRDNAVAAAAAAAASTQTSKRTISPGKKDQSTNDTPPSPSSSSSSSQDSSAPKPPTRQQPARASRNRT